MGQFGCHLSQLIAQNKLHMTKKSYIQLVAQGSVQSRNICYTMNATPHVLTTIQKGGSKRDKQLAWH